jgi:hypothetical protein
VREARAVRGDFLVGLDASVHSLGSVGERSGVDGRPAFEKHQMRGTQPNRAPRQCEPARTCLSEPEGSWVPGTQGGSRRLPGGAEGFEPLTSAVHAPALDRYEPHVPRRRRRQLELALAQRLFQRPASPAPRTSRQSRRKLLVAGRGLKAPHDHIDVERIELDAAADATGLIGLDGGRARAKERVDDVAAVR